MKSICLRLLRLITCLGCWIGLNDVPQVYGKDTVPIIVRTEPVSDSLIHERWKISKRSSTSYEDLSQITTMATAPHKNLWLGTSSGLVHYDGLNFKRPEVRPRLRTGYPPPSLNVTSLSNVVDSEDLYIGIHSRGLWHFHNSVPYSIEKMSSPLHQHSTPFVTLEVKDGVYVGGTHGLSKIDTRSKPYREELLDAGPIFDLARVKSVTKDEMLGCGESGLILLDLESQSLKLLFSRAEEAKGCRGVVSYSSQNTPNSDLVSGAFALFEDHLYLVENENVYQLTIPSIKAAWGQKPYLDKEQYLWIPTDQYLYRFAHYTEVRSQALAGQRIEPIERFDLPFTRAMHEQPRRSPVGKTSIWMASKNRELTQITKSNGQFLLPLREQASGGGPILSSHTRIGLDHLWWVESCQEIFSAIYDSRAPEPSLMQAQKLYLPDRIDGECIDALGGGHEIGAPIILARRKEVFALKANQEQPQDIEILHTWSRDCESLDCRITSLHIHKTHPLVIFAGTEAGQLLRLHISGDVDTMDIATTKSNSAITVIRSSKNSLLLGHETGVHLVDLDQQFKVLNEASLDLLPSVSIPRAPIRDLLYDHKNHIWWLASYGGGLGWLDLSQPNQVQGGQITRGLERQNRFLSGLAAVQKVIGDSNSVELWAQSNHGLIKFQLHELLKFVSGTKSPLSKDFITTLEDLDEANGWLRPSLTQIGSLIFTATTRQTELIDTSAILPMNNTIPPHVSSAIWKGENLEQTHEVSQSHLATQSNIKIPTLTAPDGSSEVEFHFAHPLGVDQPIQNILYKFSIEGQNISVPWVNLGHMKHIRISHIKPGKYTFELRTQGGSNLHQKISRLRLVIPDTLSPFTTYLLWSVLIFSLGIGLLISSLFYQQNRSLKVDVKTYELESRKAQSYLDHYKQVFDHSENAFFLFSEYNVCLEWNPKALELFKLTPQEMYHLTPQLLGIELPNARDLNESHRDIPLLCQRPFGDSFPARVSLSPHSISKDIVVTLVSIVDLSSLVKTQDERLKSQEDLAQSRRLESLGRLSGWVAHEMNNTFAEVEGILESIEDQLKQARTPVALIAKLKEISHQGHRRVQRLLSLTQERHHKLDHTTSDNILTNNIFWCTVEQLFNSNLDHLSWMLNQGQSLDIEVINKAIEDDDLLGQVFDAASSSEMELADLEEDRTSHDPQHLKINRSLFDHFTFRLILILSERAPADTCFTLQLGLTRGNTLLFRVVLPSLFYLNKSSSLPWERQRKSLVDQLMFIHHQVSHIGASLHQLHEPSHSVVSLRFPVFESETSEELIETLDDIDVFDTQNEDKGMIQEQMGTSSVEKHVGSLTNIVLVDDNQSLLKILANRLKHSGFTVYSFDDARLALDWIELGSHHINILITDVLMPHINGRQLATRLLGSHPELSVIFISAYTDDVLSPNGSFSLAENEYFMRKPFSPRQLIRLVSEVMDSKTHDEPVRVFEPLG